MNLLDEGVDGIQLLLVECALILALMEHRVAQLSPQKMVQHLPVLSGVDGGPVVQFLEFLGKLGLVRQLLQNGQNLGAHLLGAVVVGQSCRHGGRVAGHPFSRRGGGKLFLYGDKIFQ